MVMSINSKMTAIANPIRTLKGTSGAMGLDAMASNLGEVVNECDTQADLITQIKTALADKAAGVELPPLDDAVRATSSDMVRGKQLYDDNGNLVTGEIPTQGAKTITPSTSAQTAVASGVLTTGAVTVDPIPSSYVQPSGTKDITENGTHDVRNYESVNVEVEQGGDDPFAPVTLFTHQVNAVEGADYGFAVNADGYYESQNKGVKSSYAICRVSLTVNTTCDITFDVINYAEGNFDYALFSQLDTALGLSNTADSSGVKESFRGKQSASVVNVVYTDVPVGNHFVDIKFIKDGGVDKNYDSVQFKVQSISLLPQTTIEKILEADTDLISENIKSGVDIFGVIGSFEGVNDTSDYKAFIERSTANPVLPSDLEKIGDRAFYYYANMALTSLPDSISLFGTDAFAYCRNLALTTLPSKTLYINSGCFTGCSKLAITSFPSTVSSIGNYAFEDCTGLTTLTFEGTPKTISASAFYDCTNITTINVPWAEGAVANAPWGATNATINYNYTGG
jgi:hypothetical protein